MIPPRLRRADLARHLRHVALDLYERDGVEAVTADALAEASGVNRRSLFRYFSTLDDVVFSDHHVEIRPQVVTLLASSDGSTTSAAGALVPLLDSFAADENFVRRRRRVVAGAPALLDREQLWFGLYRDSLAERLSAGTTDGSDRAVAAVTAAALVAAIGQVLERWYSGEITALRPTFAALVDRVALMRPG